MTISRADTKVDIHTLAGKIKLLELKITEQNKIIQIAERILRQTLDGFSEAKEASNEAQKRFSNYINSSSSDTNRFKQLKQSVLDTRTQEGHESYRFSEARNTLEQRKSELRSLEAELVDNTKMKSSAEEAEKKSFIAAITEETTRKLFASLGIAKPEQPLIPPPYEATQEHKIDPKSSDISTSIQKPLTQHEKLLQLQSEFDAEMAEMQKRYNQKYAKIVEQLKSDEGQLHLKLSLS